MTIYTSSASSPEDEPSPRTTAEVEGGGPASAPSGSAALVSAAAEPTAEPASADWWSTRPALVGAAATALGVLVVAAMTGGMFAPDGPRPSWQSGRPAAAATPAPSATPDDTITLAGVGDVIMGSAPGSLPRNDGQGFFDPVKKSLAADLVMGNLETPLTDDTGVVKCALETPEPTEGNPSPKPRPVEGCHQFRMPPSYAGHLRDAGFQVMNLANNHIFDHGRPGFDNTKDALEEAGIEHTGAAGQITVVKVKNVRVAVIGFSIYGWTQNLNDIAAGVALVKKAARKAEIVVVQMQGGAEGADRAHVAKGHETFFGEDRGDLITFTHEMIDAGADVVFGHGPHIMRGMEFYKGRLIAYSLGNFCGYGVLSSVGYLGVGGILRVTLHPDGTWAGGTLVPTEMVGGGYVAVDKEKRAIGFVNDLSRADFGNAAARLDSKGRISPTSP